MEDINFAIKNKILFTQETLFIARKHNSVSVYSTRSTVRNKLKFFLKSENYIDSAVGFKDSKGLECKKGQKKKKREAAVIKEVVTLLPFFIYPAKCSQIPSSFS